MEKLNIIKERDTQNTFVNFKDNIIMEIFENYSISQIINIPKYKLLEIKKQYLDNSMMDGIKNAIQINYYIVRGWSDGEARKRVSEIQSKNSNKMHIKRREYPENYKPILSPYTTEFWIKKGYTIEEANLKIKESRSTSKEHWIKKGYSEEEATQRIRILQKKNSDKLQVKRNESPEQYDNILQPQLKYWTKRGYSEQDAIHKVKERQTTFTLEKCIEKYGKDKGTNVYNDRQEKWLKKLHANFEKYGDGRSIQSKWANDIKEHLALIGFDIPLKEKWIRSNGTDSKAYSYDLTIGNKIIEFNGDYWHMNPDNYDENDYNKTKKMTSNEIWQYDLDKIKLAESHGYDALTIWESDYRNNPKETIQKCVNFINN